MATSHLPDGFGMDPTMMAGAAIGLSAASRIKIDAASMGQDRSVRVGSDACGTGDPADAGPETPVPDQSPGFFVVSALVGIFLAAASLVFELR